jgi:hypothetical protein
MFPPRLHGAAGILRILTNAAGFCAVRRKKPPFFAAACF